MYNTHGAGQAQQEELAKIAHLELFAKAAMAQGIDLSALDEGTRNELYTEFTTKLAEEDAEDEEEEGPEHEAAESSDEEKGEQEEGDKDSEEEKKEAAARREYAAQVEWQEKNAQADFLGRRMAHAFWDEYREISKEAGLKDIAGKVTGASDIKAGVNMLRGKTPGLVAAGKSSKGIGAKTLARGAAKAGGIAAGAAGAAYGAKKATEKKEESKEASAFDIASAEQGLKIASASGWDENEAAQRLSAVLTLGPSESEKVAHANGNYDDAINIRGLELLEAAGYPVDWTQVFG